MPYAVNDTVRIYYEVEGDGPPLVLHTGFMLSLEGWRRLGYVDALRDAYRLILIDPRGQGRSDSPHDPRAYEALHRWNDVLAVLDAEGIDRAHFWGYSMGGRMGYGLGAHTPQRLHSLVIGGAHPFKPEWGDEPDAMLELLRQGMPAFVAAWEANDPHMTPETRAELLTLDAVATSVALEALRGEKSLAEMLPGIQVPTLIYYGTEDFPNHEPRDAPALMPRATAVALDGLDHGQAFDERDLVLSHVLPFLDGLSQPGME